MIRESRIYFVPYTDHFYYFWFSYCRYEAKLWLSQFEQFKDNKKLNWINEPQENERFDINVLGVYTIYRLFFLACSILGLLFSGYFYCFCLPYIFIKSELLSHVVKAVQGKRKLLLTMY